MDGLEVTTAHGRGIAFYDSDHVTVQNCLVHHTLTTGISLWGTNAVVDSNEVHDAVLENEGGTNTSGGWAAAVSTTWYEGQSAGVIFRRNYVHESWGECLIALFASDMEVTDNRLENCFSVHMYLDHARGVRVERNVMLRTRADHDRAGRPATGVLFGYEAYPAEERGEFPWPNEDIVIANNLLWRTGGLGAWCDENNTEGERNTLRNVVIAHNVLFEPMRNSLGFPEWCEGAPAPTNISVRNNAFLGGEGPWVPERAGYAFSHNCWQSEANPIAGAGDVNGSCGISLSGALPDLEQLRPASGAAVLNAGTPVAQVPRDFFCAERSTSTPTLGAAE
jgi:hypothetical protein